MNDLIKLLAELQLSALSPGDAIRGTATQGYVIAHYPNWIVTVHTRRIVSKETVDSETIEASALPDYVERLKEKHSKGELASLESAVYLVSRDNPSEN